MYRVISYREENVEDKYIGTLEGFRDKHPNAQILKIHYYNNNEEPEEWFDIPDYEKIYKFSNKGRVKRIKLTDGLNKVPNMVLSKNSSGLYVLMGADLKIKQYSTKQLMNMVFGYD